MELQQREEAMEAVARNQSVLRNPWNDVPTSTEHDGQGPTSGRKTHEDGYIGPDRGPNREPKTGPPLHKITTSKKSVRRPITQVGGDDLDMKNWP